MFDYHAHTSFSADCMTDIKELIQVAIKKGIQEIAITDHIDYDYPSKEINFSLNFKEYHNALNFFHKEYHDIIKIIKGIEIGLQEHILKECDETIDSFPYDFVIASIHVAQKKDLHNGDFFKDKTPLEAYEQFYTCTYNCLKNFKSYNVLGHMNLIDRYHKYIQQPVSFSKYSDIVYEILKMIIEDGKGIEINTSGFRYDMDDFLPTMEMIKMYKDLSGEIITVGSDAHTSDYLGHKIDYVYHLLKEDLGFKYITTYKNRIPKQIKL